MRSRLSVRPVLALFALGCGEVHRFAFDPSGDLQRFGGVSVGDYDSYRTPLGEIKIDKDMVKALKSSRSDIHTYKGAHALEHCLEVQLPFLQQALGDFKIVTLLMGEESIKTSSWLGKAIAESAKGKKVLIIASTDLSHYHPYDMAVSMDKETIDQILRLDSASFLIASAEGKCESCGAGATAATIVAAKQLGANKAKLLKYENSGDTAGDKSSVVGYAAIAIYKGENNHLLEEFAPLDEAQQKKLLEIARQSIEGYVKEGRVPEFRVDDPVLLEKRGVFVTIFEDGDLRGCIGTHTSDMPLYRTVSDMAVESACRDPRFAPLRKDELDRINIKVSVYLMEPTKIEGPEQIVLGEHGIIFKKGLRSSTFLPEVAVEQGWDKEATLRHLAMKAGLPADAYKSGAEFYVYKTQVFGEK